MIFIIGSYIPLWGYENRAFSSIGCFMNKGFFKTDENGNGDAREANSFAESTIVIFFCLSRSVCPSI